MMLTLPYKKLAPGDRMVPWISQCRQDWRFKPVKYLCAVNQSALSETTDPDYQFIYIDISSVDSDGRWTVSEPILFADAPSRARRIVRNGDVLISTVRTYLRAITYLPRVDQPIICSTGFAVLTGGPSYNRFWCMGSLKKVAYPAEVDPPKPLSAKEDTPHEKEYRNLPGEASGI